MNANEIETLNRWLILMCFLWEIFISLLIVMQYLSPKESTQTRNFFVAVISIWSSHTLASKSTTEYAMAWIIIYNISSDLYTMINTRIIIQNESMICFGIFFMLAFFLVCKRLFHLSLYLYPHSAGASILLIWHFQLGVCKHALRNTLILQLRQEQFLGENWR